MTESESVNFSDVAPEAEKMEVGKTYEFTGVRFEPRESDDGPYEAAFAMQKDGTEIMTGSKVIVGQFKNPKVTEFFKNGKSIKCTVKEFGKKPNQYYKLV